MYSTIEISRHDAFEIINLRLATESVTNKQLATVMFELFGEDNCNNYSVVNEYSKDCPIPQYRNEDIKNNFAFYRYSIECPDDENDELNDKQIHKRLGLNVDLHDDCVLSDVQKVSFNTILLDSSVHTMKDTECVDVLEEVGRLLQSNDLQKIHQLYSIITQHIHDKVLHMYDNKKRRIVYE